MAEVRDTIEYYLVYSELIHAARHRGTVTYQELAHVVGLPLVGSYMGSRIGELIGAVAANEVRLGRPMLSAVAVKANGDIGSGFFPFAIELGLFEPGGDELAFLEDQRKKCYKTWAQQFPKQ